jgi:Domain of unknown function (DUF3291)
MIQPPNTHLAQLNVGRTLDDTASPRLAEFMSNLDRINGIAERSPGFVWRLKSDSGNATDIQLTSDPRFTVNLSVWETPAQLEHFVWNTVHKPFYNKKANWFEKMATPHFVMWWVPVGHLPTTAEALARLKHLEINRPSAHAFGWESLPNIKLWMSQRCA